MNKKRKETERRRMEENSRIFDRQETWFRWIRSDFDMDEAKELTVICEAENEN